MHDNVISSPQNMKHLNNVFSALSSPTDKLALQGDVAKIMDFLQILGRNRLQGRLKESGFSS